MKKNIKIDNLSEISKSIIENHMVRKSIQQKKIFAEYLMNNLPEVENFNIEKINDNSNIVIGDINKVKYIFTAHYDTPATFFVIPNFLTPKNKLVYIAYQLVITAIMVGFSSLTGFLGTLIGLKFILGYLFGLFLFLFQIVNGYPNKNNYNDNTSGVITLIELYLSMSKEQRNKCAFIFFDNEEKGLKGSGAFKKKYKEILEEKEIINFDCVADGNYIFTIPKNISEETAEKICVETTYGNKNIIISDYKKTIYPSDQKKFNHSVGVAAFHKGKNVKYYVSKIHTIYDTNFDEENIFVIVKHFKKLIVEEE